MFVGSSVPGDSSSMGRGLRGRRLVVSSGVSGMGRSGVMTGWVSVVSMFFERSALVCFGLVIVMN